MPEGDKPRGHPPFEPTAEQRGQVKGFAMSGFNQTDIASYLDIDEKTLRKHFRRELDFGKMELISMASNNLNRMAVGAPAQVDEHGNVIRAEIPPNLGAICFLLKTQAKRQGWSERVELTGPNGGAITTLSETELAKLSDTELEQLIAIRLKLAAADSAPSGEGEAGAGPTPQPG